MTTTTSQKWSREAMDVAGTTIEVVKGGSGEPLLLLHGAKADIKVIDGAIQSYAMFNNGQYPDSIERLLEEDVNGISFLRRKSAPKDPWDNEYVYEPPSSNSARDYRLYTLGADGMVGGQGEDLDYDHRMLLEE